MGVTRRDFVYFLNFMALISIMVGVFNLFPFPVLDGGHLMFLIIEAIIRKPVNRKVETWVNQFGVLVLVSLMVFIVFNDVLNWRSRLELLQNLSPKK